MRPFSVATEASDWPFLFVEPYTHRRANLPWSTIGRLCPERRELVEHLGDCIGSDLGRGLRYPDPNGELD
jgi:hypothetical protein